MISDILSSIAFIVIPFLLVSSIACYLLYYTAKYLFKRDPDFVKLMRYCSIVGVILMILFIAFYRNDDF